MRFLLILVLFVALISCAAPSQVLINPKTKEKANCATWGFGFVGTPFAMVEYYSCVNKFKAMGYIPIEEYKDHGYCKDNIVNDAPPAISCECPIWMPNTSWTYSRADGQKTMRVMKKDVFKGIPVYSILDDQGKEMIFNDVLGLCAVLNCGTVECEYSPAVNNYDWPLIVGKKWESSAAIKTPCSNLNFITSYEVRGCQKVKVPAGVFDSFYIVGTNSSGMMKTIKLWYSPEVQNYVKAIMYFQDGYTVEELVGFEKGH